MIKDEEVISYLNLTFLYSQESKRVAREKDEKMAGSRWDWIYKSDNGKDYAVMLDFSNIVDNQEVLGFEPYADSSPDLTRQPVGMKLRYIEVVNPSGRFRRRIPCGRADCDAFRRRVESLLLWNYDTQTQQEFTIIKSVREYQRLPPTKVILE